MKTFFILAALSFLPLLAHAQGTDFVPLTSLPGLDQVAKANSLAPFLSELYKICIGLAAVLAVLQIMRAGVMYMGGDSITEKKEARNLIGVSLAGLLLVLSPVIVFSIINPSILQLDINGCKLQPGNPDCTGKATAPSASGTSGAGGSPATTGSATGGECDAFHSRSIAASGQTCAAKGTGWTNAPSSCCTLGAGETCCGKP